MRGVESPEIRDIIGEAELFLGLARTGILQPLVYCEGRTPPVRHGSLVVPGERTPEVNTADINEAIRLHGEIGLMACKAVENNCELKPMEDERKIILELEQKGFLRQDIMHFIIDRQIPQWYRIDEPIRPRLSEYLDENVTQRYCNLLVRDWPDFNFSLPSVLHVDSKTVSLVGDQVDERDMRYFLQQTVGHMTGIVVKGEPLTVTQEIAVAFNLLRDINFIRRLEKGWGQDDTSDTLFICGWPHVRATAGAIGQLGAPLKVV